MPFFISPDSWGSPRPAWTELNEMWSDQARAAAALARGGAYVRGYEQRKATKAADRKRKDAEAEREAKKKASGGGKPADPRKATGEETNDQGERVKKYADGSTVTVKKDGTAVHRGADGKETTGKYKDPEERRKDPEGFSADTPESKARDADRAARDTDRAARASDTEARRTQADAKRTAYDKAKKNAETRKNNDKQRAAAYRYAQVQRYSRGRKTAR